MQIIGLTGGIGSGKSTVARMLSDAGATVLDADKIYHGLIAPVDGAPSPLVRAIEQQFPGVVGSDGVLNRAMLGAQVFAHESARQRLGEITHPAIAQEFARQCLALEAQGVSTVVYDVPLWFERGMHQYAPSVVVWVPADVQLQRLITRDKLSEEAAKQRIASQMPLEQKRQLATWGVDNSGTLEETRRQVQEVWEQIRIGV